MKSKICFFHSGPTQRRLKDALAHLRSEGFTTRDQHDFIINYICKCNKQDSNLNSQSNDENFLDYLINLNNEDQNDKAKILFKIKNLLLEIYEVVKDVETKRIDFLVLVKYLQISTLYSDFSTILKNFIGCQVNFNLKISYSITFNLPISSRDYHTFFWSMAGIRFFESIFKCRIRAENNNTDCSIVTISSKKLIDFKAIKESIFERLEKSQLIQPSTVFPVKGRAHYYFRKPDFQELLKEYDCEIRFINSTNIVKLWGPSTDKVMWMKSWILNLINSSYEDDNESNCENSEEYLDDLIDQKSVTYSKRFISKINNKKNLIQSLSKLKFYYNNLNNTCFNV